MGRERKPKPGVGDNTIVNSPQLNQPIVEKMADPYEDVKLKLNHVLVVELDASGNEKPGTQFEIHSRMTEKGRAFSDETKFKVVKKSNQ